MFGVSRTQGDRTARATTAPANANRTRRRTSGLRQGALTVHFGERHEQPEPRRANVNLIDDDQLPAIKLPDLESRRRALG